MKSWDSKHLKPKNTIRQEKIDSSHRQRQIQRTTQTKTESEQIKNKHTSRNQISEERMGRFTFLSDGESVGKWSDLQEPDAIVVGSQKVSMSEGFSSFIYFATKQAWPITKLLAFSQT